jgi:hypothetical protein
MPQNSLTMPTSLRLDLALLRQISEASWRRRMSRASYIRTCLQLGMNLLEQEVGGEDATVPCLNLL